MSQFGGFQQQGQTIDPIPSVVERAMANNGLGHYSGQVRPVVQALIDREQALMDAVVAKAVEYGASPQDARDICQQIGAHFDATRSQQGQWSQQGQGQTGQNQQDPNLDDINRRLQELEQLAQQVRRQMTGGSGF